MAYYESALAMLAGGSDPKKQLDLHRWIGTVNAKTDALSED